MTYFQDLDLRLWTEAALEKRTGLLRLEKFSKLWVPNASRGWGRQWRDFLRDKRHVLVVECMLNLMVSALALATVGVLGFTVVYMIAHGASVSTVGSILFGLAIIALAGYLQVRDTAKLSFYLFLSERNITTVMSELGTAEK